MTRLARIRITHALRAVADAGYPLPPMDEMRWLHDLWRGWPRFPRLSFTQYCLDQVAFEADVARRRHEPTSSELISAALDGPGEA